ncbi:MAG: DUF805 domain-containing protein [Sulfitobacter sp.]|nr:DUF805 domain-containing protein [Sulfitobacter sp.]
MDFQTAVRTCLTQKYARFSGRAARSEYWWFFLAVLIGGIVTAFLGFINVIYGLAVICPLLSVGYRRLQDTGRPGWYIFIPFGVSLLSTLLAPTMPTEEGLAAGQMPSMGGIVLGGLLGLVQLVLMILFLWWLTRPSEPGTNAYGPPPLAATTL